MRQIDKEATREARQRHELGTAILDRFFHYDCKVILVRAKHCRPVALRQRHKRERLARQQAMRRK